MARNSFTTGFGAGMGVLLAILLFPFILIGGCLLTVGSCGVAAVRSVADHAGDIASTEATPPSQPSKSGESVVKPTAPPAEPKPADTATTTKMEETRKQRIEKGFSIWDGSQRALTEHIKDTMNDPGSYEHIKTTYFVRGDYLVVTTEFRGKNAFGGLVKNSVMAKVDLDGHVLKILTFDE